MRFEDCITRPEVLPRSTQSGNEVGDAMSLAKMLHYMTEMFRLILSRSGSDRQILLALLEVARNEQGYVKFIVI